MVCVYVAEFFFKWTFAPTRRIILYVCAFESNSIYEKMQRTNKKNWKIYGGRAQKILRYALWQKTDTGSFLQWKRPRIWNVVAFPAAVATSYVSNVCTKRVRDCFLSTWTELWHIKLNYTIKIGWFREDEENGNHIYESNEWTFSNDISHTYVEYVDLINVS